VLVPALAEFADIFSFVLLLLSRESSDWITMTSPLVFDCLQLVNAEAVVGLPGYMHLAKIFFFTSDSKRGLSVEVDLFQK